MITTDIPKELSSLIGIAAEMHGAILIYQNDRIVFANEPARSIYACQDWSTPVSFDNCFRRAIELGRIDDATILGDPEGHLVYAKMVRARERRHSFRRSYDGVLYDRHHIGLDREWNAQIWVEARRRPNVTEDQGLASNLLDHLEQSRSLLRVTALLDHMGVAMAVVAVDGRILDCSPLMASQLRAGTLFGCGEGNAIECQDEASTAQLQQAIASVASDDEQAVLVPIRVGDTVQPVAVLATPDSDGTAIVVVHDIALAEPLEDILMSAYSLTRSQAEVVVRVSGGDTADDIAAALNRPHDTVKRQIATSKAKIAVGRQHGLAHIITRVAGLFGGIQPRSNRRRKQ